MPNQRLGFSGFFVENARKRHFALQDVLVDAHGVIVAEGVDARVHFVDEDAQSPPVDGFSVTLVEDDFWGDVLWRSANGEGPAFVQDLGETEVRQLEVAVVADQQVLWLEVSKDDVLAVQVLKAGGHSGRIEAALVRREGLHRTQIGEELAAVDELEDQIEIAGVLGQSLEADDEGVVDLGVDEVLVVDVVDLLRLDDLALLEEFESHVFAVLLVLGHLDFAEAPCIRFSDTFAQSPSDFEVVELKFFNTLGLHFLHGI